MKKVFNVMAMVLLAIGNVIMTIVDLAYIAIRTIAYWIFAYTPGRVIEEWDDESHKRNVSDGVDMIGQALTQVLKWTYGVSGIDDMDEDEAN